MNRRAASFILGIALALLVGAGLWWFLGSRSERRGGPAERPEEAGPTEKVVFNLYFAEGGQLRSEPRELEVTEHPKDRIRKVVQALLEGPRQKGLAPLFPKGVTLGSVQLGEDGTAYVDLRWPEHNEPPASGSTEEIQRVYGMVNSICDNVSQAKRVVLLWNGLQRATFSGHLDTSRPLTPDRSILVR
jgi:spore germination protein GerM